MKVQVRESEERSCGDVEISASCSYGNLRGVWKGVRPVAGAVYDVEIDANLVAEIGKNASVTLETKAGFLVEENITKVFGRIESIEDDGFAYVRIGTDALIMLETFGDDFQNGQCIELRLSPQELFLTPFGSK